MTARERAKLHKQLDCIIDREKTEPTTIPFLRAYFKVSLITSRQKAALWRRRTGKELPRLVAG